MGALFLLVFSPLAFGTVHPWSEAIAELVVLGVVATYVIGGLLHWELRVELPPGWLPATLFLALVTIQAFAPLSLDPHATWREALKLLGVAAFFVVCYNTYRTRAQAQRALWTMIAMGAIISIFGIVQRVTWDGRLYWIGPEAPGSAFGPFVNRTHFAALMVIVVPAAIAFGLVGERGARRARWVRSWRDRFREWNSAEARPTRLMPILILVMGGAALVSGSRGGIVALLTALLAMTFGSITAGGPWRQATRLALVTVLIVLAGVWIGAEIIYATVGRLAEEVGQAERGERVRIWADAIRLWRAGPLIGTGLATFGVAFPRFRTLQMPYVYSHAESDWVQLLTDTGILGLGLVVTAGAALARALLHCYRHADGRWVRVLNLAGFVALIGTGIQGVANYNAPVMSNFIYLAVVVALVCPGRGIEEERI